MRKFLSVESFGVVAGLLIIAQALHKSNLVSDYDPSAQISLGLTVMTGAWLAPTRSLDEKIAQTIAPVDRAISSPTMPDDSGTTQQ
ncbi:hypothetical protein IQ268_08800 [Oculatella sp. LEGE 06141]|uniref:hypothetical protein n=1 Tax=Oculatella sp. LEGE 06141 TaxID=1828648 RepID=UPI001880313E|nr:hypothetical protein [Oculatella sp. LEGE 06141]MBE9178656.1 hypothetical protein [Oculatella sp. LEGE 06141]